MHTTKAKFEYAPQKKPQPYFPGLYKHPDTQAIILISTINSTCGTVVSESPFASNLRPDIPHQRIGEIIQFTTQEKATFTPLEGTLFLQTPTLTYA